MALERRSNSEGLVVSTLLFAATLYWVRRTLAAKERKSATSFLQRRSRSLNDLQQVEGEVSARGQTARVPPIPYLRQLLVCFQVSRSINLSRKCWGVNGGRHWVECEQTDSTCYNRCDVSLYFNNFFRILIYINQSILLIVNDRTLQDPCDPLHNPTGYIALCTAENKLITPLLAERCMQVGTATTAFADTSVFCYNSFLGLPIARQAAAYFLARRFLFYDRPDLTPPEALVHISPSHVALSAGAAPLLQHLFFLLGQPGDACFIPAPYYTAFESDMHVIAGIVPFPVEQANPLRGPTPEELEVAWVQARSQGLRPKFLLLTNPHNPLAVIYRRGVLESAVAWARKRQLQTIVDEVYALSVHEVSSCCSRRVECVLLSGC